MSLHLDWASHKAALHAVQNWHYSRCMPSSKTVKIGVWENDRFIGVVIFSRGACANIGKPYNLQQTEICELTRIALDKHEAPVSRIVRIAILFLKRSNPGLKLIVSYADPAQGHYGGIYKAGGWIYTGKTENKPTIRIKGRVRHTRSVSSVFGSSSLPWLRKHIDPAAEMVAQPGKHRYLFPLTKGIRGKVETLSKLYPECPASIDGDAPVSQTGQGGSIPTAGL